MNAPETMPTPQPLAAPLNTPCNTHGSAHAVPAWLTLIGVGEDGATGLNAASRTALGAAELIFGSPRQLVLLGLERDTRARLWPVPLALGELMAHRGRKVVALASGDPFHFGLGATLARALPAHEWRCAGTSASAFSMMAARMGWALQEVVCLGLHAAPLAQLRVHLRDGARCLVLLHDAKAIDKLADYLKNHGFGASKIRLFAALGGPRELCADYPNADFVEQADKIQPHADGRFSHYLPICAALHILTDYNYKKNEYPCDFVTTPGRSVDDFEHDGQISKSPIRALTLAALAPRTGQRLLDLGAGSGAVSVEWCLASGGSALCVERDDQRAQRIVRNAQTWGLKKSQLRVLQANWGDMPSMEDFVPHAIFIGGGLSAAHWAALFPHIPPQCRVVVNAVTLDSQTLIMELQKKLGGQLCKYDWAENSPLGSFQIWKPAATLMQWVWCK